MVRSVIVSTLMAVLCTSALAVEGDDVRERAVELYDAGDYAAALPLLEQLDAAGEADGPLLYRLAFARNRTGDGAGSADAQTRALAALEREYSEGGGIETAFYLSNAYRNVRRVDDSRRVASETTTRVESGELAVPDDPLA